MRLRKPERVDLRKLRLQRRLSLRVAARSAGVSASTLSRAERGREVSATNANLISAFYGVHPDSWHLR